MPTVACIDIGSNSVLLTVAVPEGNWISEIVTGENITRLGAGLIRAPRLMSGSMEATCAAVAEFVEKAKSAGALRMRLVGTQALRKAMNSNELKDLIHSKTGYDVDVISGEEEARLSFLATDGSLLPGKDKIVTDVGGGSTEVISGHSGMIRQSVSMPLGCVTLSERFSYPQDRESLRQYVNSFLDQNLFVPPGPGPLVAIGGTATGLAAINLKLLEYDPRKVHGLVLSAKWIAAFANEFAAKSGSKGLAIPYVSPARANVLGAGTEILLALMRKLRVLEITISDAGLRHAVAWELLNS